MHRKTWHVEHLDIVDEPMILSLLKYRQYEDRQPSDVDANVVSSHLVGSHKHAPILDLDFPHVYVPSTTDGHAHLTLYQKEPASRIARLIHRMWVVFLHGCWRRVFR